MITDNGDGDLLQVVSIAPYVPEPATWAMLVLGLGMIGLAARQRRRDLGTAAA
jgi:hypothetical protein